MKKEVPEEESVPVGAEEEPVETVSEKKPAAEGKKRKRRKSSADLSEMNGGQMKKEVPEEVAQTQAKQTHNDEEARAYKTDWKKLDSVSNTSFRMVWALEGE